MMRFLIIVTIILVGLQACQAGVSRVGVSSPPSLRALASFSSWRRLRGGEERGGEEDDEVEVEQMDKPPVTLEEKLRDAVRY